MDLDQKATLTAEARNKELELRWTMTQLFFFIHSALFSLALTQFKPGEFVHIGSCLFGLWLGCMWHLTTLRSQDMLAYWNKKLAELENNQPATIMVFVTVEGKIPSSPGWSMDWLLTQLVRTFIFAWGALLVFSIYTLLSKGVSCVS